MICGGRGGREKGRSRSLALREDAVVVILVGGFGLFGCLDVWMGVEGGLREERGSRVHFDPSSKVTDAALLGFFLP